MWRSLFAIVAGFLVIGTLSFGTDAIVRTMVPGAFDGAGQDRLALLLLSILYVGAYAVFGCWLTARLAPDRPLRHALILGVLGLCFNIAGTIAMWDKAPVWYHVVQLALVMPYAWLGGRLRERQLERSPSSRRAMAA